VQARPSFVRAVETDKPGETHRLLTLWIVSFATERVGVSFGAAVPTGTVTLMSQRGRVSNERRIPGGVVHELPPDLRTALIANPVALEAWEDITPLARNEFICWVEDAKQERTRERRIRRTQEELEEGRRRPCCWPGCRHRERTGG